MIAQTGQKLDIPESVILGVYIFSNMNSVVQIETQLINSSSFTLR